MAEMVGGGGGKKGGPKGKKKSTRIDMTAMVDVAFLLLTFFVLTATMSNSSLLDLTMPPKDQEKPKVIDEVEVREDKVMSIILCAGDTIKYFVGVTDAEVKYAKTDVEIREAITAHLKKAGPLCEGAVTANCWDPIFVIKPRYNSRYQNFVDVMDEMAITGAKKYAVADFTKDDSTKLVELEMPK